MSFTLEELKNRLKQLDEMTLLETLRLTSEELVELLEDKISDDFERLEADLQEDEEEE